MTDLHIWYYTSGRKPKTVPQLDDVWLRENFVPGETPEGLAYPWVEYDPKQGFPPPEESDRLPESLFLIVRRRDELRLDFMPYRGNLFIVSEAFLDFMTRHGLRDHVEASRLKTVDMEQGAFDPGRPYYALRVGVFDDARFELGAEKKRAAGLKNRFLYPEMALTTDLPSGGLFFLDEFCYREALLLTGSLVDEVKASFHAPELYRLADFPAVFNNRGRPELLPPVGM